MRMKLCDKEECFTCTTIQQLKTHPSVAACLHGAPYQGPAKELPISACLGDNTFAVQNFSDNKLGLPANVCQTHTSAIPANNGTHKKHFHDMEIYEAFYQFICRIARITYKHAGTHIQVLLVEWLQANGEEEASTWFRQFWVADGKGRWLLADLFIGMIPNNQGLEATWRWDRTAICNGYQVGLGVYMAGMLKTMRSSAKQQAADFRLAGHENFFPSKPKAESGDWDLLQTLDVRTLLFTDLVSGDGTIWDSAVASICADVENFSQLTNNLNHVRRTVCPTTHARNLIMPTQALIKRLLKENPDAENMELLRLVRKCADDYKHYFIRDRLDEGRPHLSSIDAGLTLFESFHVLEAMDEKWSEVHLFKCNCLKFFKTGSCHSSLLAGMVCDPKIQVPKKYLGITLQNRRKRGRPAGKEQMGDLEAAKCRAYTELQQQYQVPKVPFELRVRSDPTPPPVVSTANSQTLCAGGDRS
jgi:hypothetical protein